MSPLLYLNTKLDTNAPLQIYHATCHAGAVISTNTLAAHPKNEEGEWELFWDA